MFKKHGVFDINLGRTRGKLYAGEDSRFLKKLLDAGEKVLYFPPAVVEHFIPKHRISKKYFRRWDFDQGELNAVLFGHYPHRNVLGIPYYIIRQLIEYLLAYILRKICLSRDRFILELRVAKLLGFVLGRIRYRQ